MGNRISHLRTVRRLSVRELAALSGLPYADLIALEQGRRREPSPELVRRLADLFHTTGDYLMHGTEPSAAHLRAGFLRAYESLEAAERQRLKFAPIQERVAVALRFLEQSYPDLLHRSAVAARLGYTPQALDDVLGGTAPLESHLLQLLAKLLGLTRHFFVRGDLFGGVVDKEAGVDPNRLNEYYQVVQEAIAAGVSPDTLRKAIQILSIREQED
jgi:transcriptional regulator with XRE-family HTH domain